jgi:ribonuclease P protein component
MPGFLFPKDDGNEADLPTLGGAPEADARLSRTHAHSRRSRGDPRAPGEGPRPPRHLTRTPGPARARLHRSQRLGAREVSAVLKSGRLVRAPRVHLYSLPNGVGRARLALIVPKRFAPRAVLRNRIRRLAREAFRLAQAAIGARDCVVRLVAAPGERPITLDEVQAILRTGADG